MLGIFHFELNADIMLIFPSKKPSINHVV